MQTDYPTLLSLKHLLLSMFQQGIFSFNTNLSQFNFDISINDYFKVILPIIQKSTDTRGEDDIKLVYGYFSYLKDFIATIKELDSDNDNYLETLRTVASFLTCEFKKKNRIIIQQGEKGNKFYMILQGSVEVLTAKSIKGTLYEKTYYRYLGLLIKYNEFELLDIVLRDNYGVFPIEIINCGNYGRVKLKKITQFEKTNLTLEFILSHLTEEDKDKIKSFYSHGSSRFSKENHTNIEVTSEDYIKRLAIEFDIDNSNNKKEDNETGNDKPIKTNKKLKFSVKKSALFKDAITNLNDNINVNMSPHIMKKPLIIKNKIFINLKRRLNKSKTTKNISKECIKKNNSIFYEDDKYNSEDDKTEEDQLLQKSPKPKPFNQGHLYHLLIYNYTKITTLSTGKNFGDVALIQSGQLRTATIISNEQCYFGILSKANYTKSLKKANMRIKKKLHAFIRSTKIFYELPIRLTEIYERYFVINKINRGDIIIKQYSLNDKIFLLREGTYEASINTSICRLSAIINYFYKKIDISLRKDKENHRMMKNSITKMNLINKRIQGLIEEMKDIKEFYLEKHKYCLWNIEAPDCFGFQQLDYGDDGYAMTIKCISVKGEYLHLEKSSYDNLCRLDSEVKKNENECCYIKIVKFIQRMIVIQETIVQAYLITNDQLISQMFLSDNLTLLSAPLLKVNSCKEIKIKANADMSNLQSSSEKKLQMKDNKNHIGTKVERSIKEISKVNAGNASKSTFNTNITKSSRHHMKRNNNTEMLLPCFKTDFPHSLITKPIISFPKFIKNPNRIDEISKVFRENYSFEHIAKLSSSSAQQKTKKIAKITNSYMKKRYFPNHSMDKYDDIKEQDLLIKKNKQLIKSTKEVFNKKKRKNHICINKTPFNSFIQLNTIYINK